MATDKNPGDANSPRDFDEIDILLQGQDNGLIATPMPAGDGVKSPRCHRAPRPYAVPDRDRPDHGRPRPRPRRQRGGADAGRTGCRLPDPGGPRHRGSHAVGIILGDIKPGNLVLDTTGTVRVLELGVARIVDANNLFARTPVQRSPRMAWTWELLISWLPNTSKGHIELTIGLTSTAWAAYCISC